MGGYTFFTPHYMTWYCPDAFVKSKQCQLQCINHEVTDRYHVPDLEQDFSKGYEGRDVVTINLRLLCVSSVANASSKSWVWWDYVTDFHIKYPMSENKYNQECVEVIGSLGIPVNKVCECMGNLDFDMSNPLLKSKQDATECSCRCGCWSRIR
ncbi:hypothetical protein L7F22_000341 [Adiantum nelumboides]|nr:hypothetical protein [Adiantum nelumboides]